MRMTLAECRHRFPSRPDPAPREFSGQWIAWDHSHTKIVAHGNDFAEVHRAANSCGIAEPLMQKVISTPFVGARISK